MFKKILKNFDSKDDLKVAINRDLPGQSVNTPAELRYSCHITTDKEIYKPGEIVFVRGIVLNMFTHTPCENSTFEDERIVINASVVNASGKHVLKRYPISKPIMSVLSFHWKIPLNVNGGVFKVIVESVCSSEFDDTIPYFPRTSREFSIYQVQDSIYKKHLIFMKESYTAGEDALCLFRAVNQLSNSCPTRGSIEVILKSSKKKYFDENFPVDEETGYAVIRFTVPKVKNSPLFLRIILTENGKDTYEEILKIFPLAINSITVFFHPEGGALIQGFENNVYFESFDRFGVECDIEGILVEEQNGGSKLLLEVESYHCGRGMFTFKPLPNCTYSLEISHPKGIPPIKLPEPKEAGVLMILKKKKAFDFMEFIPVIIYTTKKFSGFLRLFKKELEIESKRLEIPENGKANIEISTQQNDGIMTLSVCTKNGNVACERIIFVKPKDEIRYKIRDLQGKKHYVPGEKVELYVSSYSSLTDKPITAITGITVTSMKNNPQNINRIFDQHYLEDEILRIGQPNSYIFPKKQVVSDSTFGEKKPLEQNFDSDKCLDLLTGIQGWRKLLISRFNKRSYSLFDEYQKQNIEKLYRLLGKPDIFRYHEYEQMRIECEELESELREKKVDLQTINKNKKKSKLLKKYNRIYKEKLIQIEQARLRDEKGSALNFFEDYIPGENNYRNEFKKKIGGNIPFNQKEKRLMDVKDVKVQKLSDDLKKTINEKFRSSIIPRVHFSIQRRQTNVYGKNQENKKKKRKKKMFKNIDDLKDRLIKDISELEDQIKRKNDLLYNVRYYFQKEYIHLIDDNRQPDLRDDYAETLFHTSFILTSPGTNIMSVNYQEKINSGKFEIMDDSNVMFDLCDNDSSDYLVLIDGFTEDGLLGFDNTHRIKVVKPFIIVLMVPSRCSIYDIVRCPIQIINNLGRKLIVQIRATVKPFFDEDEKIYEELLLTEKISEQERKEIESLVEVIPERFEKQFESYQKLSEFFLVKFNGGEEKEVEVMDEEKSDNFDYDDSFELGTPCVEESDLEFFDGSFGSNAGKHNSLRFGEKRKIVFQAQSKSLFLTRVCHSQENLILLTHIGYPWYFHFSRLVKAQEEIRIKFFIQEKGFVQKSVMSKFNFIQTHAIGVFDKILSQKVSDNPFFVPFRDIFSVVYENRILMRLKKFIFEEEKMIIHNDEFFVKMLKKLFKGMEEISSGDFLNTTGYFELFMKNRIILQDDDPKGKEDNLQRLKKKLFVTILGLVHLLEIVDFRGLNKRIGFKKDKIMKMSEKFIKDNLQSLFKFDFKEISEKIIKRNNPSGSKKLNSLIKKKLHSPRGNGESDREFSIQLSKSEKFLVVMELCKVEKFRKELLMKVQSFCEDVLQDESSKENEKIEENLYVLSSFSITMSSFLNDKNNSGKNIIEKFKKIRTQLNKTIEKFYRIEGSFWNELCSNSSLFLNYEYVEGVKYDNKVVEVTCLCILSLIEEYEIYKEKISKGIDYLSKCMKFGLYGSSMYISHLCVECLCKFITCSGIDVTDYAILNSSHLECFEMSVNGLKVKKRQNHMKGKVSFIHEIEKMFKLGENEIVFKNTCEDKKMMIPVAFDCCAYYKDPIEDIKNSAYFDFEVSLKKKIVKFGKGTTCNIIIRNNKHKGALRDLILCIRLPSGLSHVESQMKELEKQNKINHFLFEKQSRYVYIFIEKVNKYEERNFSFIVCGITPGIYFSEPSTIWEKHRNHIIFSRGLEVEILN